MFVILNVAYFLYVGAFRHKLGAATASRALILIGRQADPQGYYEREGEPPLLRGPM